MFKWFEDLKIKKKLLITFIIISLLASIPGVINLCVYKYADTQYSNALDDYGFPQGEIGMLMSTINNTATNIVLIVASDKEEDINRAEKKIEDNAALLDKYLAEVGDSTITNEEKSTFKRVTDTYPLYQENVKKIISLAKNNEDASALELLNGDAGKQIDEINDAVSDLLSLNMTIGHKISDDLTKQSGHTIIGMIASTILVLVISIILAVNRSNKIATPLAACSKRLEELSLGLLKTPVPEINTKDELGSLAASTRGISQSVSALVEDTVYALTEMANGNLSISFESQYPNDVAPVATNMVKILESLNTAMAQIKQSSDEVASGAGQVSSGAQLLSQGSSQQAASIEELTTTIMDISQQVRENSEASEKASAQAIAVGDYMHRSNGQMQEMIDAMKEISNSSNEIAKIIKTIEDIAFQTNILALNAAVEAARAGEAGKGFAVVADEVRSLANKSAEASNDTTLLIESSLNAVEKGTRIANITAQTLSSAVEGSKEVTATISKISEASASQSYAIEQITSGIEQISAVVQTNSGTAEESAAISEELSSQSQILDSLIANFKLKGQEKNNYKFSFSQPSDTISLQYNEPKNGSQKY